VLSFGEVAIVSLALFLLMTGEMAHEGQFRTAARIIVTIIVHASRNVACGRCSVQISSEKQDILNISVYFLSSPKANAEIEPLN
jgi:hypothetical protein